MPFLDVERLPATVEMVLLLGRDSSFYPFLVVFAYLYDNKILLTPDIYVVYLKELNYRFDDSIVASDLAFPSVLRLERFRIFDSITFSSPPYILPSL